ncbi:MAG: GNAT family N-acetyltransferase [Gemmatimonadetes bacterium]|nr:GNAT family N-acetyltransferase [Gemmatimonadota bacterium]
MMARARSVAFADIDHLRSRHRAEADFQIVRDSILPRGLAEPFALELDGEVVGYAGVWTEHFPGRVMEFYLVPEARSHRHDCSRALLEASGAVEIEAQTNLPLLHSVLRRFSTDVRVENILFAEPPRAEDPLSTLSSPHVHFRSRQPGDDGPPGDWVLARRDDGAIVAAGGFLQHYNPPYCDLFMEVAPEERRRGYGSDLVRELRKASKDAGLIPAARCDADNEASRRTLFRGGMVECGRIVAGRVDLRNLVG